jgi:ADP-ribose pyrophosphatase
MEHEAYLGGFETIASEQIHEGPDFTVRRDTIEKPDGSRVDVEYVSEPPAVVVYPFTPDGEVVVIDEWRQPVGRVSRGLPVGSLEPGEDLLEAARRELREETGYEAADLEHLHSVEPSNGLSDSIHHHVEARGCTPTASQDLDADEAIETATVPQEALEAALGAGDLRDGRTALAVAARAFRNP